MAVIFSSSGINAALKPFLALSRPESIRRIDQHHREINSKSLALSAEDDHLATMKTYLLNAALKQE